MGDPEDTGDPVRRAGGKGGGRRARRPPEASGGPSDIIDDTNGKAAAGAALRPSRPAGLVAGKAMAETAFDIWLRRSLHAMFDRYKDEAIPAEWLRLIEEDRARRRSG